MARKATERIPLLPHSVSPYSGDTDNLGIRQRYIQNLTDCLHVCLLKGDTTRAYRAWSILVRCREVDWRSRWSWGLALLSSDHDRSGGRIPTSEGQGDGRDVEKYLKTMRLNAPEADKASLLHALVLHYIQAAEYRAALDELETYLTGYPYVLSGSLHTYAGMLSFYLAQPARPSSPRPGEGASRSSSSLTGDWRSRNGPADADQGMIKAARAWFAKALEIDAGDDVAGEWIRLIDRSDGTYAGASEDDGARDSPSRSRSSSMISQD